MDSAHSSLPVLWASATGICLAYLALAPGNADSILYNLHAVSENLHPSKPLLMPVNGILTIAQKQTSPADTTTVYVLFASFSVASIAYTIASQSIYARVDKNASKAILVCLVALGCLTIWAPSAMTGSERLLVLLPLTMSAGLSWAVYRKRYGAPGTGSHSMEKR
jgi:hypothetical protein